MYHTHTHRYTHQGPSRARKLPKKNRCKREASQTAPHCTTLQLAATHCITLQHAGGPAAALANLEIIENEKLVTNSRNMGVYLETKLKDLQEKYLLIGDVRGRGLFQVFIFDVFVICFDFILYSKTFHWAIYIYIYICIYTYIYVYICT